MSKSRIANINNGARMILSSEARMPFPLLFPERGVLRVIVPSFMTICPIPRKCITHWDAIANAIRPSGASAQECHYHLPLQVHGVEHSLKEQQSG